MSGPAFNWPADHRDILPDPTNGRLRVFDLRERGEITVEQGNVMLIHAEAVRIIRNSLPRHVRQALNAAVKRGELAHLKREGHKPEVYFRPQARDKAVTVRWREEQKALAYSRGVMVTQRELDAAGGSA